MEEKELDAYSQVIDEDNTNNIFLYNSKDEPIEFEQICTVPIDDRSFCILKPVVPLDGMQDDEALAFELVVEEGEGDFVLVDDDEMNNQIFDVYAKLMAEAEVQK